DARQARAALREFYSQQARADLGAWLPKYLPALPRAPLSFRLRPLSSLWGSLSPADALSLDLALVLGRPSALEYVLVHELCHLIHANHSRAYWREVEMRWPDCRGECADLHTDGPDLESAQARLAGWARWLRFTRRRGNRAAAARPPPAAPSAGDGRPGPAAGGCRPRRRRARTGLPR